MKYDAAILKSWQEVDGLTEKRSLTVRLLNDNYTVDLDKKEILSLSCNVPAKIYTATDT